MWMDSTALTGDRLGRSSFSKLFSELREAGILFYGGNKKMSRAPMVTQVLECTMSLLVLVHHVLPLLFVLRLLQWGRVFDCGLS